MELLYKYMEYFGFISGILYLIFEIKQNKYMWGVGILSAAAYLVLFAGSSLYAAMGLQGYYLIVSMYGWAEWQRGERELAQRTAKADLRDTLDPQRPAQAIFYRNPSAKTVAVGAVLFLVIFGLLLTVLKNLTGDPMPAADAAATALSVVATYWLSRSYRVQWLLWVVVNTLTVLLCFSQQLYLTSGLYLIYTVSAFYGYLHWGRKGTLLN